MKTPQLPQLNADISQLSQELTKAIWHQFQRGLDKIGHLNDGIKEAVTSVNELLSYIHSVLHAVLKDREEGFWQLLYVVDLPEAYLENIELSEKGLEKCARVVLIREWQKVILRQHFSAT